MLDRKSAPLSPARRAGTLLFLSGQIAFDEEGRMAPPDIEAQTRQVLKNIEAVLAANEASLGDIVSASVFLTNEDDFGAFNAVYATYFPADPPARTTVIARLLGGAIVEIAVVAEPRA
ncbi:RidA family protein [Azospirillum sp. TSA6c]|uniref:RidA family protein n=1 Tax=unclassified Azospirillum TaxID=2630922 RepID=UPI000D615C83|nr:RidA family protein [Azospirillum sp. TSA6c]PWC47021.1 hypothetical protein TSA6c_09905 [Azospirillum sp. TSA6c]PWC53201.1 hypothetical protein TSA6c_02890 [Azospirillum sp. TSA6c]